MQCVGRAIEAYGRVVSPIGRSLLWRASRGAALVWNRPVGVVVEDATGVRHVRIPDRTRQIQWGLLAAGLGIALTMRLVGRPRSPRRVPRWR